MVFDIVYQDDQVIIVNKPQGMTVEPERNCGGLALTVLMKEEYGKLHAVHRLDAKTGGLTLLAKTKEAKYQAEDAFRQNTADSVKGYDSSSIKKIYLCQTIVRPQPPQGELRAFLLKNPEMAKTQVFLTPTRGAHLARTVYRTIMVLDDDTALVGVRLLTGRTHQIRAQFAYAKFPILGDDKYGNWQVNNRMRVKSQRLWAVGMVFAQLDGALSGLSGREFWVNADFAPDLDVRAVGILKPLYS
ncbi:hypothetical protein AGMMS49992_07380 [Clostridia bacterium]|nr:hypothetical protein AGMMS49992_07380 [Clostridia bacterium]